MTSNNMVNIYLYTRYERFWHWMQTALILLLLVTGFELNGLFTLFGFKAAAEIHNYCRPHLADPVRVFRVLALHDR